MGSTTGCPMPRDAAKLLEELEQDPELVERLTRCLASHSYRSRAERGYRRRKAQAGVAVVRDRVLVSLRESGRWCTVRDIADAAEVGVPTARYHLEVLVKRGEARQTADVFRAVEETCP